MDHFNYNNNILYAENSSIPAIANEVETPFYLYSKATLERHYKVFSQAFSSVDNMICFAVKANSNIAVLKILADLGAGADTVSEGEIRRARAANIPPERIIFSGVGKSRNEIRYALGINIAQFNVESVEELQAISQEAVALGVQANVAIRVNPDVDAKTLDKISTGRKADKFGISWDSTIDAYALAAKLPAVNIVGVTTHIGSQLVDLSPFQDAFERIKMLVTTLRDAGHNIATLDLGGGLGIPYSNEKPPSPDEYASMILSVVKDLDCKLILEPGRLIAGNAGILVTKVIRVKKTQDRDFVIVDAAMNDLVRPSVYGAYHEIIPVMRLDEDTKNDNKEPNQTEAEFDVVGPVCESADVFGRGRNLPANISEDDLLAIRSSGAYGAVMSSTYNSRLMIPEVLVDDDVYKIIRQRPTYNQMLGLDVVQ